MNWWTDKFVYGGSYMLYMLHIFWVYILLFICLFYQVTGLLFLVAVVLWGANFVILPAQIKRVSSSTIVRGTEEELTGPVFTATVCALSGPTGHWKHILQDHRRLQDNEKGGDRHFFCESCEFRENYTQRTFFFIHLAHHLRNRQTVHCPFLWCEFKTNNLRTFTSSQKTGT